MLQFDKDFSEESGGSGATGSASDFTVADLSHRYLWGAAVDQILADEVVSDEIATQNVRWTLVDHQNSVRDIAIYDSATETTSVVTHITYDAYGNVTGAIDPATGLPATVTCLFGFTGKLFDAHTGLQNNLNRWYDPKTGNWMSEAPISFKAGDVNTSRYCGNDPVNHTDPTGLSDIAIPITVGGGAAAAANASGALGAAAASPAAPAVAAAAAAPVCAYGGYKIGAFVADYTTVPITEAFFDWWYEPALSAGGQGFKGTEQRKQLESLKNSMKQQLKGRQREQFKKEIEDYKIGE